MAPEDAPPAPRRITLVEALIVAAILVLLAIMLIPAMRMIQDASGHQSCSEHQRQIVMAMQAYAHQHAGSWPVGGDGQPTPGAPAGPEAWARRSMASLALLPSAMGGDLSPRTFGCPGQPKVHPAAPPDQDPAAWTAPLALDATNAQAYAYDWSIPATSAGYRVVLGDRPLRNAPHPPTSHGIYVVFTCTDGHGGTRMIQSRPAPESDPRRTATQSGHGDRMATPIRHQEAMDDDVFAMAGDDGAPLAMNAGSPTRAFLK